MKFETESALCKAYRDYSEREGGVVYNETAGWDMLVLLETGEQIGIQAKLKDNVEVLHQAMRGKRMRERPRFCGVLVPFARDAFLDVASCLGLNVFQVNLKRSEPENDYFEFTSTTVIDHLFTGINPNPEVQCRLPRMVPEVPAGVPSPRKFGPWTERELRLEVLFHRRGGWCNTKDFKRVGLDPRRFLPSWLYRSRDNHFEAVIAADLPSKHHPKNYATIKREMEPVRS